MSDDWETPKWLLQVAFPDGRYFDPCPIGGVRKKDGLKEKWPTDKPVFINPPWSRPLPWVERAAKHTGPVALLLPVETTSPWWPLSGFFKVSLIDANMTFIGWTDPKQSNLSGERAPQVFSRMNKRRFACAWWWKP